MSSNVVQKCSKCGSEKIKIGFAFRKNGSKVYPRYCEDCGTGCNGLASKQEASSVLYELKYLEFISSNISKLIGIGCHVCGDKDVELHHIAPRHLFGSECELWPTVYLCKKHHKQWHDLVTPNMCNK